MRARVEIERVSNGYIVTDYQTGGATISVYDTLRQALTAVAFALDFVIGREVRIVNPKLEDDK